MATSASTEPGAATRWFSDVQPGDWLRPDPFWNQTERPPHHLPTPVQVLAVTPARSQSGVLFTVRTANGQERQLDAGWFLGRHLTTERET